MPKLSPKQKAVLEYMRKSNNALMVWPPDGFSTGHSQFGETWGHYTPSLQAPKVTYATIRAMIRCGCFIVVDRTNANSTSSGKNAAVRYRINPDLKAD